MSRLHNCICDFAFHLRHKMARILFLGLLVYLLYFVWSWHVFERSNPNINKSLNFSKWHSIITADNFRREFHEKSGINRKDENAARNWITGENELKQIGENIKHMAQVVASCKNVPGMAVVLVKGEHSLLLPIGKANLESKQPVQSNTRFLLNSISKTFLGQLIAVLLTESPKNITWDSRARDILGSEFKLATEELTREVTLRDLLSHRTGLSSGNLAVRATYPDGVTRAELVKQLHHLPASAEFRKSFLYSNMCGMLVAHIAEKLGNASWEDLIVKKLLKPLGMSQSGPLRSHLDFDEDVFARPYVPTNGNLTVCDSRLFGLGPLSPVASLTSSPRDMAKWIRFNLRRGHLEDGKQLISSSIWSDMWHHQADLSPMFLAAVDKSSNLWPVHDVSSGYGLYWFINTYRGLKNYWHGGGLYTFYGLTWTFPEKEVGLYISINGFSGDSKPFAVVESLAYYAADMLLGYQPWINEQSVCLYPSLSSLKNSVPQKKARRDSEKKAFKEFKESIPVLTNNLVQRGDRNINAIQIQELNREINSLLSKENQVVRLPKGNNSLEKNLGSRGIGHDHLELSVTDELKISSKSLSFHTGENAESKKNAYRMYTKLAAIVDRNHSWILGNASKMLPLLFNSRATVGGSKSMQNVNSITHHNESDLLILGLKTPQFAVTDHLGIYRNALVGNLSVFINSYTQNLECKMVMLTGILRPLDNETFGVELIQSLRFMSKPSDQLPAKTVFKVEFIKNAFNKIYAIDVYSNWAIELPLRFLKS